jgi:hypothetical protein
MGFLLRRNSKPLTIRREGFFVHNTNKRKTPHYLSWGFLTALSGQFLAAEFGA